MSLWIPGLIIAIVAITGIIISLFFKGSK